MSIRYLALGLETSISILAFLREFAGEFLWYLLVLLIFDSEFIDKNVNCIVPHYHVYK